MSLILAACSGASKPVRSSAEALASLPDEVIMQADLSTLPHVEGRLDDALQAATAVVLGMRRIEDACGTYIDVRLFPEVFLGGRAASEPLDAEEFLELRALVALPNPKGTCEEPRARTMGTNQLAVGDRVVVALGAASVRSRQTPQWKRNWRIVGLAPINVLPTMVAALPLPQFSEDDEQFLPVPRMPGIGTPASSRLLGKQVRFDVQGEEIIDRAQGVVWQRDVANYKMSVEEAGLYCQASRTGGHDDWRLPTAIEMQGLFSPAIPPPAVVDAKLFSAPEGGLFWTRTDDDGAWVGLPHEGILISTHYDDPSPYGNYHVRCVRPGNARATEMVDRFGLKDGLLSDISSGLAWHFGPQKRGVTQSVAKTYCEQGTFGGFDDWRLPAPEEAFSLMSGCPGELQAWEGDDDEVWTSMTDPERKVGGTFEVCNLYRSVPMAAIFDKEGIDPKNPLARVMCTRTTSQEVPPESPACPVGSDWKTRDHFASCEERNVRHGSYRSSWPSGGVFEMATYDHGNRSGVSMTYHENGSVYARREFVNGKLHGEAWAKRPTGAFLFKGAYKNGLPSGRWVFYDPQGHEVEFIEIVEGKSGPGQYVRFGEDGAKMVECPTLGGWEHGIQRIFRDAKGTLVAESSYRGGWLEGPERTFDGGHGGSTGLYHRGEREGIWVHKNPEGKIVFKQSWRQDKLDGVQETFDDKGNLTLSQRYREGIPVAGWELKNKDGQIDQRVVMDGEGTGTMTTYTQGQVYREETYFRGKKSGTWRVYGEAHKLRQQEEYRDDALVSATEWYGDGQVRERRNYADGRMHGLYERYFMPGKLQQRGMYERGLREGHWEFTTVSGRHFEVDFVKGKAVNVTEGKGGR